MFQLSKEVQTQAVALKNHEVYSQKRVRELEEMLVKWKSILHTSENSDNFFVVFEEQLEKIKEMTKENETLKETIKELTDQSHLTEKEREEIQIDTILMKNEEIETIKKDFMDQINEMEMKVQEKDDQLHRMEKEFKDREAELKEKVQQDATTQIEENIQYYQNQVASAMDTINQLKREKESLALDFTRYQEAATLRLQSQTSNADEKLQKLYGELQDVNSQHRQEFQIYKDAIRKEMESAHSREIFNCTSIRHENEYLTKRVQELEKITKSLQYALRCEKDQGAHLVCSQDTAPVYLYPVITK